MRVQHSSKLGEIGYPDRLNTGTVRFDLCTDILPQMFFLEPIPCREATRYKFNEVVKQVQKTAIDWLIFFIQCSFFGEDPPLLAIFLKKLGYEVT